jgi:hypothetical protein
MERELKSDEKKIGGAGEKKNRKKWHFIKNVRLGAQKARNVPTFLKKRAVSHVGRNLSAVSEKYFGGQFITPKKTRILFLILSYIPQFVAFSSVIKGE